MRCLLWLDPSSLSRSIFSPFCSSLQRYMGLVMHVILTFSWNNHHIENASKSQLSNDGFSIGWFRFHFVCNCVENLWLLMWIRLSKWINNNFNWKWAHSTENYRNLVRLKITKRKNSHSNQLRNDVLNENFPLFHWKNVDDSIFSSELQHKIIRNSIEMNWRRWKKQNKHIIEIAWEFRKNMSRPDLNHVLLWIDISASIFSAKQYLLIRFDYILTISQINDCIVCMKFAL